VLNSGAEGPGFKSQPRRCRVTVLGKLFTLILLLFTNHVSGEGANVLHSTGDRDNDSAIVNRCSPALANRFRRYDAPANGRASASRRRPNWLLVIRCADDKTIDKRDGAGRMDERRFVSLDISFTVPKIRYDKTRDAILTCARKPT